MPILENSARMTVSHTDNVRLGYLDGWRGCAILAVLVGHFAISQPLWIGRFGVELFFVLSGRLMAELLFVRGQTLPTFFKRRASRIYPALLVFLTIFAIIAVARGHKDQLAAYASAATLVYNYTNSLTGRVGAIDHVWSLCIEEHAYIALATLAAFSRRCSVPALPVLFALIVLCVSNGLVQTMNGGDYYQVYWRTDVRGASILIGAAVYMISVGYHAPHWLAPALVALGLGFSAPMLPDPVKYTLGTGCLAAALATLPLVHRSALNAASSEPLQFCGRASYSLYLWQQPFAALRWGHGPLWLAIILPAIAIGTLSLWFVERPTRDRLNRWWEDRQENKSALVVG